MAQTRSTSAKNRLTPLWVISLFLSLTEVIAGFALTKAGGGVQIALTAFVIAFPLLIAVAFFLILWFRPYVLYPPTEYAGMDVQQFVNAMQRRQTDEKRTLELVQQTMSSAAATPEMQQFAETTIKRLHEHLVTVNLAPITARNDDTYVAPFEPNRAVHEFLDDMWFALSDFVPPYTFGTVWALRDATSGIMFLDTGRGWAKKHRKKDDVRMLNEVGFRPGMELEAVLVNEEKQRNRKGVAA